MQRLHFQESTHLVNSLILFPLRIIELATEHPYLRKIYTTTIADDSKEAQCLQNSHKDRELELSSEQDSCCEVSLQHPFPVYFLKQKTTVLTCAKQKRTLE